MKDKIFWVLAAFLTAIAAHLGYILLLPSLELNKMTQTIESYAAQNDVVVLTPDQALGLLGNNTIGFATAICQYDLQRSGTVAFKAVIPRGYWTMLIYSSNGDLIHTINDRQAGAQSIDIAIRAADAENAAKNKKPNSNLRRLAVKSPTRKGLVVLSAAVSHPALRAEIEATLVKSRCAGAGEAAISTGNTSG